MKNKIENKLGCLTNQNMSKIGRASTTVWIQFGQLKRVKTYKGSFKEVGKYALHIQCPWRLINSESKIIIGSGDIFIPKDKNLNDDTFIDEFNALFDVIAKDIPDKIIVNKVEADETGSVKIKFKNAWELLILVDTSYNDEYYENWRFFEPGTQKDHFVI